MSHAVIECRTVCVWYTELHGSPSATCPSPPLPHCSRKLRAGISPVDSCRRFADELHVDVYIGRASFTSRNTVSVGGQTLKFAKACVATGGRANVPPIPGLKDTSFLTNATLYNLTVR